MPMEQALLLIILCAVTLSYMIHWLPSEVTSILAIASLALTGLLTPDQALSGFSSTATLTVGAMFVLSSGLIRTGVLETVTINLTRLAQNNPRRLLLLLGVIVPMASAVINNTPVVIMMVPVALSLGRQFGIRPSKLLIPISYFSLLGGTWTLIGTSTNILLDDLYRKAGGPGFSMFEFTSFGMIYTAVGFLFILFLSPRLLPDRTPLTELFGNRQKSTYVTEVAIGAESNLVGKMAEQVFENIAAVESNIRPQLRMHRRLGKSIRISRPPNHDDTPIELLQIARNGYTYRAGEIGQLTLEINDTLMVSATPQKLAHFLESTSTHPISVIEANEQIAEEQSAVDNFEQQVVEAVVLPESPYNERLVKELELHRLYGVRIMGVQHHGRRQLRELRDIRLESGDVLLLQAPPSNLHAASEAGRLLIVEGIDRSILRSKKNRLALLIMMAVVGLAAFTSIPIVVLALAGAGLMVTARCLRVDEALRSLDANTLLLLAAAIPLGTAMKTTGLAQAAVDLLLIGFGKASPTLFLAAFYLLTTLIAQFVNHKAVVVLFTPIALSLATTLSLSPTPLLMAIAFGANGSFMTPIGHQVNAIVMGPGGYTFTDYMRVGIPMMIVLWLTATFCIPFFWPLQP